MQNATEIAESCFKQGFSCSQAILSTFGEQFGLDSDTALKLAAGFGGGMGRMAVSAILHLHFTRMVVKKDESFHVADLVAQRHFEKEELVQ